MNDDQAVLARRTVLGGALAGAGLLALGGTASAARPRRVLIATNEPWGTYHVKPLLAEADRRGWQLTQLVPDRSGVAPGDPVPVAVPGEVSRADLLVVTGAEEWPAECAARFRRLPLAASSLAYLNPREAARARWLRPRLRAITASSPAEARAFAGYLGTRRKIQVVGAPQADSLPVRAPEPGLVLVLTSVTHPDDTGAAAPGTELLLAAAEKLQAAGKRILVGLHPREDPSLWSRYEISDVPSLQASARAEAAIGIPGTVFPLIAAVGTPLVGCVDPALTVPEHLLAVCSSTIADPASAVSAVDSAELPDAAVLADAVGPVGGSAARLLDVWARVSRR
ncbi:hypothetical protein SAMN05421805_101322 [Saccharopolyspora antimicrobica]|uniref:Uncharacterized protein n=1 Tax=Saccharopolyspora antimicrobica TaxID=455193 RepID=A0A1I4QYK1_9PSEU|nr:hypothetical protein [Saccharopolyspora antimicrobica]RKT88240.1 hypothetical protein ATL45_6670 [Saccharopolyspora antimicrobica]SFM45162.1 hypothetical protein SAMN05421805_101322 [Saccharopolyspora antimicrobica]